MSHRTEPGYRPACENPESPRPGLYFDRQCRACMTMSIAAALNAPGVMTRETDTGVVAPLAEVTLSRIRAEYESYDPLRVMAERMLA